MVDPIEKSRQEYRLDEEKKEAYKKLSGLFEQAEASGLRDALNLPTELKTRALKEVPNFRASLAELLNQRLQDESEKVSEESRQLIIDIVEGIAEVNRIEADLRALDSDDEELEDSTEATEKAEAVNE